MIELSIYKKKYMHHTLSTACNWL